MPSIQITSVNYNDQVASITFYSSSDPATPVSLGSHTMPYIRTDNDVYGTYELNFAAYSKICSISLSAPTTTTAAPTTTTAAPTTTAEPTTTTTAPTTTTTTTAPTTTTTTTAAPAGVFTLSGAGDAAVNGCYSEAGAHNGKPYYSNGTYFVWYDGFEWSWYINQTVGTGAPLYAGSDENNVPSSWGEVIGSSPAPTLTSGCGGATTTTTTTAEPTTTTTTTTAAPVAGYVVSGAGSAVVNGTYCEEGVLDTGEFGLRPYYKKQAESYYIYFSSYAWMIGPSLTTDDFMYLDYSYSPTLLPPETNWVVDFGATGIEPGPTLATTTCGATTTAAPTTTTTTTAAPAGAFTLSGAGSPTTNGCYVEAGVYDGVPYYTNGAYFVHYDSGTWYLRGDLQSGTPPEYSGGNDSSTFPSAWVSIFGQEPAPTVSNGCGTTTTTTAAPTTTTTTTTAAPEIPPNAPTSLAATAGNAQIALTWTAPSAPGSSAITGYTVEYTPSGGSATTVNTGSTSTSYTLTGLTNGTSHSVRVRAVSAAGNGDYSTAVTGTPVIQLTATNFAASGNFGDQIVSLGTAAKEVAATDWRVTGTTSWGDSYSNLAPFRTRLESRHYSEFRKPEWPSHFPPTFEIGHTPSNPSDAVSVILWASRSPSTSGNFTSSWTLHGYVGGVLKYEATFNWNFYVAPGD